MGAVPASFARELCGFRSTNRNPSPTTRGVDEPNTQGAATDVTGWADEPFPMLLTLDSVVARNRGLASRGGMR